MNKLCLSALVFCYSLFFVSFLAQAQTSGKASDMEKSGTNKSKISSNLPKLKSRDRFMFEFTHDNWVNKPDTIKTKWYSRGFNAFLMWDIALNKKKTVAIAPGLGISTTNVFHNTFITADRLNSGKDTTLFTIIPTLVPNHSSENPDDSTALDYSKNKLTVASIDIPVELRFRTNPSKGKPFKFAIGARLGYVFNAHTKYKGDDYRDGSGRQVTLKEAPAAGINRLKYGVTARIGYDKINLFGYYSLSKLFDTSRAAEITPISVGINIGIF